MVLSGCTCFWPDKVQVYPSSSTLLDFHLFFGRFLANQRPSIVLPYAPHTNADVRGDPLHTPHHAIRQHTYLPTHLCRDTYLVDTTHVYQSATDGSASAASEVEVRSIYSIYTMQELRAAAAKQADTCVAGVAWCGMWTVEGVSPYVGIRIGGIGW